jgi:Peptidase A4 family
MRHRLFVTSVVLLSTILPGLFAMTPSSWAEPTATPHVKSPYLAGAVVYGSVAKQMTALWVVPKATCSSTDAASFMELGDFSSSPSEPGLELSAAGVNINCQQREAVYQPYTYHGSQTPAETNYSNKVSPGDLMVLSISATSRGCTSSITDLTQRWTESWNIAGTSDGLVGGQFGLNPVFNSATTTLPLTELGNTQVGNPLYHKVVVLATTASGTSIALLPPTTAVPTPVRLDDLTAGSTTLLAVTSDLEPLGGFTVTWLRAS